MEEIKFHQKRDDILGNCFDQANTCIDILVTNLNSVEHHLSAICTKVENNVAVRVLALNPLHDFVEMRYKDIKFETPDKFNAEMIRALKLFQDEKKQRSTRDNFKIKIFNYPPSIMLFRSDTIALVGFILKKGKARNKFHLEFSRYNDHGQENISYSSLKKHFDDLWDDGASIIIEDDSDLDKYKWCEKDKTTSFTPSSTKGNTTLNLWKTLPLINTIVNLWKAIF